MSSPDTTFNPTLIDTIIGYLKQSLPQGYFKEFYYGDPFDIPNELMPCVCVEPLRTRIIQGPTGMDKIASTVVIKLIYNKRNDFGKSSSEELGIRKLEEFAEGIDVSSLEYDIRTVSSVLRKNFTLGSLITEETMVINYGIVQRPNDSLTAECQITVEIEQFRLVSGRT